MSMASVQELGRHIEDLTKTPASDALFLTEQERNILSLWDQEEELRLEINLLKAQRDSITQEDDISRLSDSEIQAQLQQAEQELLDARSKYNIRNNIINQVLITDPILKSIHSDPSKITHLEQRLKALVDERDILAMVSSHLSKLHSQTRFDLTKVEAMNVEILASNKAMSKRMLELAKDVKVERVEKVRDERTRERLEKLESDLKEERKKWRVWKSITAGVIAGSGVDWAGRPELLEVVLDEEDELI